MGMPPRTFILLDALAASISVAVMVAIGYTGGIWVPRSIWEGLTVDYTILIALIIPVSMFFLYRHLAYEKKKCALTEAGTTHAPEHPMIDP
jgi:membrane protein DedA with SNARE-associated domain